MYTQLELHSQVMPILWSKLDHDGNSQKSEQHLGSDSCKGTLRLRSEHTAWLSSYFHYSLLPRCHKDMSDRYQKIANWELHELIISYNTCLWLKVTQNSEIMIVRKVVRLVCGSGKCWFYMDFVWSVWLVLYIMQSRLSTSQHLAASHHI